MLNWKVSSAVLGFAIMALYPLFQTNFYIMHIMILFFIWSSVASNWNLLMGVAGISSLGNIGFLAVGGYASGILAKHFGWSPWGCMILGGLSSMVIVTLLVGLPALRLNGIYVALLSLIFADTLPTILTQTRSITGGAMGLHDIPPFFDDITRVQAYYIVFCFFIFIHVTIFWITRSSSGLAFVALRDSKEFATALGISEYKEKIKVFTMVSFMTGLCGGFYVHYLGDISPSTLGIEPFLLTIAMLELGGIGTFMGPIIGSAVIVFGNEFLRFAGTLRLAILGGLICTTILFFPGGIIQLIDWIDKKISFRKNRSSL